MVATMINAGVLIERLPVGTEDEFVTCRKAGKVTWWRCDLLLREG